MKRGRGGPGTVSDGGLHRIAAAASRKSKVRRGNGTAVHSSPRTNKHYKSMGFYNNDHDTPKSKHQMLEETLRFDLELIRSRKQSGRGISRAEMETDHEESINGSLGKGCISPQTKDLTSLLLSMSQGKSSPHGKKDKSREREVVKETSKRHGKELIIETDGEMTEKRAKERIEDMENREEEKKVEKRDPRKNTKKNLRRLSISKPSPAPSPAAATSNAATNSEDRNNSTFKVSARKMAWTDDENNNLVRLVEEYGARNWSVVAKMMPGRSGKQCRERWTNHLMPGLRKGPLSTEEKKIFAILHQKHGNRWTDIAKLMPGRTDNALKNYYNSMKRSRNRALQNLMNRRRQNSTDFVPASGTTVDRLQQNSYQNTPAPPPPPLTGARSAMSTEAHPSIRIAKMTSRPSYPMGRQPPYVGNAREIYDNRVRRPRNHQRTAVGSYGVPLPARTIRQSAMPAIVSVADSNSSGNIGQGSMRSPSSSPRNSNALTLKSTSGIPRPPPMPLPRSNLIPSVRSFDTYNSSGRRHHIPPEWSEIKTSDGDHSGFSNAEGYVYPSVERAWQHERQRAKENSSEQNSDPTTGSESSGSRTSSNGRSTSFFPMHNSYEDELLMQHLGSHRKWSDDFKGLKETFHGEIKHSVSVSIQTETIQRSRHSRKTLLVSHPACLEHATNNGHFESSSRLRSVLKSLSAPEFRELEWHCAEYPVSMNDLVAAHEPFYVEAILKLCNMCESGIFPKISLDPPHNDITISKGTKSAILFAAGSVISGVSAVMRGSARNAFCAVRPPGHHACKVKPNGFCFFNNVAIGAIYARRKYKLDRIAVVDFDMHHGSGTQEILKNDASFMYISVHREDVFPKSSTQYHSSWNVVNIPVTNATEFVESSEIISKRLAKFQPQIVLMSAGFDGHKSDLKKNSLQLSEMDYDLVTKNILRVAATSCEGRVISVLEGGYNATGLASCCASHVRTLMDRGIATVTAREEKINGTCDRGNGSDSASSNTPAIATVDIKKEPGRKAS